VLVVEMDGDFGEQQVGHGSAIRIVQLRNAGRRYLRVKEVSIVADSPRAFILRDNGCAGALGLGESCAFALVFAPQQEGPATATLMIKTNSAKAGGGRRLSGIGVRSASILVYPHQATLAATVGGTDEATITVIRPSNLPATTIEISLANPSREFALDKSQCTRGPVSPGDGCHLGVTFAPRRAGLQEARVTIADSPTHSSVDVVLSGTAMTATPEAVVSLRELAFLTVVGATERESVAVLNRGGAPLKVLNVSLRGSSRDFSLPPSSCARKTIAPDDACDLVVSFAPKRTGRQTATLEIAHNAPKGPLLVSLRGQGIPQRGSPAPAPGDDSRPVPPSGVDLTVQVVADPTCQAPSGSVTSTPAGLTCSVDQVGTPCTVTFPTGTSVTLGHTQGSMTKFLGFGGDCAGDACDLVMDRAHTVRATFCGLIP